MAQLLVQETARDVPVLLSKKLAAGSASAMGHFRSPMLQQSADPLDTGKVFPDLVFVVRFSSPKSHIKPESEVRNIHLATFSTVSVADPGFPRGGGANSPGGRQHTMPYFPKKLHEIERIWPPPQISH